MFFSWNLKTIIWTGVCQIDLFPLLLVLSDFRSRDGRHSVDELGPEQNVGVVEHAVLQGHDDKLKFKQNKTLYSRT